MPYTSQNQRTGDRNQSFHGQNQSYHGQNQSFHGQRDGRQYGNQKNQTFGELAVEVKGLFFKDGLYNEILKMKDTDKLDILLEETERFVKELGVQITTSQMRNIYDKAIKAKDCKSLKMLRPQLAYIAGRDKSDDKKKFLAFLDNVIQSIKGTEQEEKEQHKNFNVFFEAVVAYHRLHGKNNN